MVHACQPSPNFPSKEALLHNCTCALDLESGASSSSSSLTNKQGERRSGVEGVVRPPIVARAYGPFLGIRRVGPASLSRSLLPSCVASLLHKSLRWLVVVCFLVERPSVFRGPTHFSTRAPQASIVRPARSFGSLRTRTFSAPRDAPDGQRTHTHTQAACNSVMDSPSLDVRACPFLSLPPRLPLPFFATRFTPFASTADAAAATPSRDLSAGRLPLPDVILGLHAPRV